MSSPARMPTTPTSPSTPTGTGPASDPLGTSAAAAARDLRPGQPTRARSTAPSTLRLGLARGRLELKMFFRSKETVVFTFAFPIMLLLLFSSIFGGEVGHTGVDYKQVLVSGVIAAGVMSVSFSSLAIGIALERHDGTIKRLAGTPMPKGAYFIGKIVLTFVASLLETVILLAIGAGLCGLHLPSDAAHWFTFVWVFVLGVTSCSLLGIAYSRLPRTAKSAPAIVNPPFIALQFISGVWILQSQIPAGLRAVASLFPLQWMVQGFRSAFLPDAFAVAEPAGSWQHPVIFAVLTAWCVGGFVLCMVTFRWKAED